MPEKAARLLFQLPRDCRVFVALSPANQWGYSEVFLNKTAYLLETIVWQNSNMGAKKSKQTKKPEPFIPEFMKQPSEISKEAETHSTEDIRNILNLPRE